MNIRPFAPQALEGELLGNEIAAIPKQTYEPFRPGKETTWTDEEFVQLPRQVAEAIAEAYKEGRGTLVADAYRRTRTWLPNNVLGKPKLQAWSTASRRKGKYRWLEVSFTSAGGGYSVVTLRYIDRSAPPEYKQVWYQSVLHHSMAAGNWRRTVAHELRKMHRNALAKKKTVPKLGYTRRIGYSG